VFLVLPVSLVFPVFPDFLVPSVRVPDTPREYIASAPRAVAVTEVGGAPVQLVGSQYLVQDLPPVTVANPPCVDDF
jgi:hypothetical protein